MDAYTAVPLHRTNRFWAMRGPERAELVSQLESMSADGR